jgi:uncharacterized membrane protein YhaH (DUF805 family)
LPIKYPSRKENAQIAQLVEQMPEEHRVGGSNPPLGTISSLPETMPTVGNSMTFLQAIKICFKNSFNFSGRASRRELWLWILFSIALVAILTFCTSFVSERYVLTVQAIATFTLLFPTSSATLRRLHDTGMNGWWFVFLFPLALLTALINKGTEGENRYGPKPSSSNPENFYTITKADVLKIAKFYTYIFLSIIIFFTALSYIARALNP